MVALLVASIATGCAPWTAPEEPAAAKTLPSRDDLLARGAEAFAHPEPFRAECQPHSECSAELWSCPCGFEHYGSGGGIVYRGQCFAGRRSLAAESAREGHAGFVVLDVTDESFCRDSADDDDCGDLELLTCVIVDVDPCEGSVTTVCNGDFDEKGEEEWSPDGFFVWRHTFEPPRRELLFEEVHRPPPEP